MILAKNIPGSFHSILETFAKNKLNIIYIATSEPSFEKYLQLLLYVDFTGSKVKPEDVIKELRLNKNVFSIERMDPVVEGILIDTFHFPVTISGVRAIILRKPIFEALIKGFREKFGSVGEAFLYYIGYEVGREALRSHYEMSISKNVEDLLKLNEALFKALGWGKLKVLKYSLEDCFAIVTIENSFECELGRGAKKPYSQFIRGALAGWFSEVVKKKCTAEETRCLAKGDKYCEFHIKPLLPETQRWS